MFQDVKAWTRPIPISVLLLALQLSQVLLHRPCPALHLLRSRVPDPALHPAPRLPICQVSDPVCCHRVSQVLFHSQVAQPNNFLTYLYSQKILPSLRICRCNFVKVTAIAIVIVHQVSFATPKKKMRRLFHGVLEHR